MQKMVDLNSKWNDLNQWNEPSKLLDDLIAVVCHSGLLSRFQTQDVLFFRIHEQAYDFSSCRRHQRNHYTVPRDANINCNFRANKI